jgi:hypothetical protein
LIDSRVPPATKFGSTKLAKMRKTKDGKPNTKPNNDKTAIKMASPTSDPCSNALLYAYEYLLLDKDDHNVTGDKTADGFACDWNDDDSAECGTPHPTPRDNHATLWMTCNNQDSILQDLKDFFRMAKQCLECTLTVRQLPPTSSSSDAMDRIEVIKGDENNNNNNKTVLWQGTIHGQVYPEANVGRYAMFHATTEEGCELMVKCVSLSTWGYMTFLFHDRVEIDLTSGMKIISTTGVGLDDDDDGKGVSTRFQLQLNKQDVGRCHLSYRDISNDPSMGPTIEMIEVRKEDRGKDFLPILWFWVLRFIQDNCITESLNNDAPVGHVMIKATRLKTREIEQKDGKPVFEKDFFYNHAGFSVRRQVDILVNSRSKRPIDEEAVLYIPLLSPEQRRQRMETGEDFGKKFEWPEHRGARACTTCRQVRLGLSRCHQCGKAYYCDRKCQKKDWKLHRLWCGRTRDEVREELLKLGIF